MYVAKNASPVLPAVKVFFKTSWEAQFAVASCNGGSTSPGGEFLAAEYYEPGSIIIPGRFAFTYECHN